MSLILNYDNLFLIYNSLFKHAKSEVINIIDTNNNKIWCEYFINNLSNIYNIEDLNNNILLDIIIFNDYNLLLPIKNEILLKLNNGGILIIENLNNIDENEIINNFTDILNNFQLYYFITINNNKIFLLIKNGYSLFNHQNKITIITPCTRSSNLFYIKDTLNFDYIEEWIIIYDETKISTNLNLFSQYEKIKEYLHCSEGISGNPQRNYGLELLKNKDNKIIYYLDDDNIINKNLYLLLNIIDNDYFYTFNMKYLMDNNNAIISGNFNNNVLPNIDTSMFLVPNKLTENVKWELNLYNADQIYLYYINNNNKNKHVYCNNTLSYYNFMNFVNCVNLFIDNNTFFSILNLNHIVYLDISTNYNYNLDIINNKSIEITLICLENEDVIKTNLLNLLNNVDSNKLLYTKAHYFNININEINKMHNIFSFNGEILYDNYYNILKYYYNILDLIFIYIVYNWDNNIVQNSTYNSINTLKMKILFKKKINSNINLFILEK